ncbi:MAG: recombination protein RecR [Lentisphaerae bacterium]|nr:recombination protein RecR [Lentisphaerota bacterium]
MKTYPAAIEELMLFLKQLPGVGKRGAERMVMDILDWDKSDIASFANAVLKIATDITFCPECGNCAEHGQLCSICSDPRRDNSTLCVVETIPQLLAVESGGSYRGKYLVLGGKLSPLDGENGENLNFDLLLKQSAKPELKEIILALSSDVEGRATMIYLTELLKDFSGALTRPAQGLPAGANLSFADSATVAAAFTGRTSF